MPKPVLTQEVIDLLNSKYDLYHTAKFVDDDPISIPHQYSDPKDIEITGLWTALLAWGQRKTIINKANELFALMDGAPYQFITQHQPKDRKRFSNFKHRTFNAEDSYCFLEFLQLLYQEHESLETVFYKDESIETGLAHFRSCFEDFSGKDSRTKKHIATPLNKSACKRLNMFLRWMVRQDEDGVDFGIWKKINPAHLYIPLDVHVGRVARHLGLIDRKQNDWQTVKDLTAVLKTADPNDPVKYDFALFGMGVMDSWDV